MTPLHLLHMYEHEIRWAKQAKLNKLQSWTKLEGANSIEPKLWLELLLDSTNFGSQLGTSTMRSLSRVRYSDRPNVRFGRTVRPNCSAKLLLCGSAQMTELFSAEHRTFFVLHSMAMSPFSSLLVYRQNSQKNANRAKIGIKLSN